MHSTNKWQQQVINTYNNNRNQQQYPKILKCPRCQCYSYRYV